MNKKIGCNIKIDTGNSDWSIFKNCDREHHEHQYSAIHKLYIIFLRVLLYKIFHNFKKKTLKLLNFKGYFFFKSWKIFSGQ